MAQKKLIQGQPKFNDLSQYNFADDAQPPYNYEASTGLPNNIDKFQNKDLHTTVVGDELNEKIIEQNLKFEGESFIRIDALRIDNTGVNYDVKNCRVRAFLFSKESMISASGYSPLSANLTHGQLDDIISNQDYKIYDKSFSDKGEGQGIGNLTDLEGINIISNFSAQTLTEIDFEEELPGDNFNTGSAFVLSDMEDTTLLSTKILNENVTSYNIYITRNSK